MPPSKAAKNAADRRREQLDVNFPELTEEQKQGWTQRRNKGFIALPRPWPHIALAMDSLSKNKPLSGVLLDLWCCRWDDSPLVEISSERERAYACGWAGERGAETWRQRMKILADHGFIHVRSGPKGPMQWVVVANPYQALASIKESGKGGGLDEDIWRALLERCVVSCTTELKDIVAETKKPKSAASAGSAKKKKATP